LVSNIYTQDEKFRRKLIARFNTIGPFKVDDFVNSCLNDPTHLAKLSLCKSMNGMANIKIKPILSAHACIRVHKRQLIKNFYNHFLGYNIKGAQIGGIMADFITAPEISPLFS
ncbi:hypothetical protein MXB_1089, partial [Myxobolus squamalis]